MARRCPLLTSKLEEDLVGGHPVEAGRTTPDLTPIGALEHGRLGDPITTLAHSSQDTQVQFQTVGEFWKDGGQGQGLIKCGERRDVMSFVYHRIYQQFDASFLWK